MFLWFLFRGHHGAVRHIERNPAFSKYFLSVGDWSFRVSLL